MVDKSIEQLEKIRAARLSAEWSDKKYTINGSDDYEDNLNTLDAFAWGLDAATNLFKVHNIATPKALRDLRIDLRNFLISGNSKYFRKDLFPNYAANRPKDASSYMHLKIGCSVAISLLLQAKFGSLPECASYVLKKLDAHKINFKREKRTPQTLIEWRKEISIRKVDILKYHEYLVCLQMLGNQDQTKELDQSSFKGWYVNLQTVPKTDSELIKNADELIAKTVLSCPDLVKPVKTNRVG